MSLDIINDLVTKFGNQMQDELSSVTEAVIPELDSSRSGIRKRAIQCLGEHDPSSLDYCNMHKVLKFKMHAFAISIQILQSCNGLPGAERSSCCPD